MKMDDSIQAAFDFAKHVVENWDDYPEDFIAIPIESGVLAKIMTVERRRIIAELKHSPCQSVQELAGKLHRDETRVGRDLKPLIDVGLVRVEPFGKSKKLSATNRPMIIQ